MYLEHTAVPGLAFLLNLTYLTGTAGHERETA